MIKRLLPLIVIGPVLVALAVAWFVFQYGPLSGREDGWDGFGEVFASYSVMFCIATYVPVFLFWLIARTGGWRREDE